MSLMCRLLKIFQLRRYGIPDESLDESKKLIFSVLDITYTRRYCRTFYLVSAFDGLVSIYSDSLGV